MPSRSPRSCWAYTRIPNNYERRGTFFHSFRVHIGRVSFRFPYPGTYRSFSSQRRNCNATTSDNGGPIDFSDVSGGATTSGQPRTYVVKKGDSLSKIAKEFYNDAKMWKKIFQANKDQIKNPDLIRPGQKLIIPD